MMNPSRTPADVSAPPAVEVRLAGELFRRVARGAADALVARGWGEWIGSGRRRYVGLTPSAPVSSLSHGLQGDGTRPVRGDSTCRYRGDGQLMGNPEFLREHIPAR